MTARSRFTAVALISFLLPVVFPACLELFAGASPNRIAGGPGELVDREIAAPSPCPMGLAWDGSALWVSDRREDTLQRLDPDSGAISGTLPAPGYQPAGLAWDGECLWCADQEEGRLFRIHTDTGLVERALEAPWPNPAGLAWDGHHLWVVDGREQVICKVDPSDGTTISSIPAPSGRPQGLAFDGTLLWCADRGEDRLYAISPDGGEVLVTLFSPGPYPTGLACCGADSLWAVDYQTDRLSRLATRPETPAIFLDDQRQARITVTTDVLNFGPDGMETLDLYLAVPGPLPAQELIGEPVFTPAPSEMLADQWGQAVARFHFDQVPGGASRRVQMATEAGISRIRHLVYPDQVGPLDLVPKAIGESYLADSEKFELNHPTIRQTVQTVVGDERNPYWIARRIYHYLHEQLYYELAGGWNTAPAVLERGNGSCSEYTFCFIALCRAAGLPARYAGSVVVRGDDASYDDVFHRWAEVYLPNVGWIPVDPSGGDNPTPAEQAAYFGELANRFLITTHGGGDSSYLAWNYNHNQDWTTRGRARIRTETVAEWDPLGATSGELIDTPQAAESCARP